MQDIFERYEKKYLITEKQRDALHEVLANHMVPDQYSDYLVQNLYYDTERWDVIRTSIEKPAYKEKMRLRCYGETDGDSLCYLELKKKYKGVVYKRRIAIPAQSLVNGSVRSIVSAAPSQIAKELCFYLQSNDVSKKIYISYQRIAFAGKEAAGLRVTFDTDIRFRLHDLNFAHSNDGQRILPTGYMLMEVKVLGGMPLWLAGALSINGIFPTAFSKYGSCYTEYIVRKKEERMVKISA